MQWDLNQCSNDKFRVGFLAFCLILQKIVLENLLGWRVSSPPVLKHQNVPLFGNQVLAGVIIQMRAHWGFPGGSDCKESACNSGDLGPLPRLGRSPAEGNSYPLQYSCLGNSMERGAWRTTVHRGHKASYMTERLTLSQATKLLVFKGI